MTAHLELWYNRIENSKLKDNTIQLSNMNNGEKGQKTNRE